MSEHLWAFNEFHESSVCESCNRIAAFGAIRRAAEVAREMDNAADRASFDDCYQFIDMAKGARAAIRAAIGSDKL